MKLIDLLREHFIFSLFQITENRSYKLDIAEKESYVEYIIIFGQYFRRNSRQVIALLKTNSFLSVFE